MRVWCSVLPEGWPRGGLEHARYFGAKYKPGPERRHPHPPRHIILTPSSLSDTPPPHNLVLSRRHAGKITVSSRPPPRRAEGGSERRCLGPGAEPPGRAPCPRQTGQAGRQADRRAPKRFKPLASSRPRVFHHPDMVRGCFVFVSRGTGEFPISDPARCV